MTPDKYHLVQFRLEQIDEFRKDVNAMIANGWTPVGSVHIVPFGNANYQTNGHYLIQQLQRFEYEQ